MHPLVLRSLMWFTVLLAIHYCGMHEYCTAVIFAVAAWRMRAPSDAVPRSAVLVLLLLAGIIYGVAERRAIVFTVPAAVLGYNVAYPLMSDNARGVDRLSAELSLLLWCVKVADGISRGSMPVPTFAGFFDATLAAFFAGASVWIILSVIFGVRGLTFVGLVAWCIALMLARP